MNPAVKFDYLVNEISFELFENTFYDINGQKQSHLINLVQSVPIKNITESSKKSDLLDLIGFSVDSINDKEYCKNLLLQNYENILVSNGFNGNDEETTKTIEKKLKEFESETKRRLMENTELQIKEVSEFKKLRSSMDDDRARAINLKKSVADKILAADLFYKKERQELLRQNMDTMRLINHVLEDAPNEKKKHDLIRYVISSKKMLMKKIKLKDAKSN